ncbi:hypothetical protein H7Y21_03375 [Arenimonas sp.]|nr:hypothetical protein [Candidatus Parcubacteria bacterium]
MYIRRTMYPTLTTKKSMMKKGLLIITVSMVTLATLLYTYPERSKEILGLNPTTEEAIKALKDAGYKNPSLVIRTKEGMMVFEAYNTKTGHTVWVKY